MKKALVFILLSLMPVILSAQTDVDGFGGIRLYQNMGLELGVTWNNRIGIKAITQCDWHNPSIFKDKEKNLAGKTHRIMYGGGVLFRIAGPIWISLDAGYGWHAEYAYDSQTGNLGAVHMVKGLDLGAEIRWDFSENWYVTAGYETIPLGFKKGTPVHEIILGVGFKAPL